MNDLLTLGNALVLWVKRSGDDLGAYVDKLFNHELLSIIGKKYFTRKKLKNVKKKNTIKNILKLNLDQTNHNNDCTGKGFKKFQENSNLSNCKKFKIIAKYGWRKQGGRS